MKQHLNYSLTFFLITLIYSPIYSEDDPEDFVKNGQFVELPAQTEGYLEIIKPFLPDNPIILEAGCHDGEDTVIMSKTWPLGRIYAFEPVPKYVDLAHEKINNNKISNVFIYSQALAVNSGRQTFFFSGGASSLLPSNNICRYPDTVMSVDTINLDEWAQENNVQAIDFMWLDMEGNEYPVLKSAPTILKTVKVIFTEVNFREFRKGGTLYNDLYTFLKAHNFTLFKIWGNPKWQANAIFIRNDLIKNNT